MLVEGGGNNDSRLGRTDHEEAALFVFSCDNVTKANQPSFLPPVDVINFLRGFDDVCDSAPVLRTLGVDASQIGKTENEKESPRLGSSLSGARDSLLFTSFGNNSNNDLRSEVDMTSNAFEPIPLRNNSPAPLARTLQLRASPWWTTKTAPDVVLHEKEAGSVEHQLGVRMANCEQFFMGQHHLLGTPRSSSTGTATAAAEGDMQLVGTTPSDHNANLFHVNGAPAALGSLGWCTNLSNPRVFSIPGSSNGLPWAHAQNHPVMCTAPPPPTMLEPQRSFTNQALNSVALLPSPSKIPQDAIGASKPSDDAMSESGKASTLVVATGSVREVSSNDNNSNISSSADSHNKSKDNRRRGITNPNSRDVCFALIKHPGTKVWRALVDSLAVQPDVFWSDGICRLVKSQLQLEGRRFLVCDSNKGIQSKVLKNRKWCIASDKEIWLRTRQRFRDCRKSSGTGSVGKTKKSPPPSRTATTINKKSLPRRNVVAAVRELKNTANDLPSNAVSKSTVTSSAAAATVNLASVLAQAIAQCQIAVDQSASQRATTSTATSPSDEHCVIQKAVRAKEKLELLTPLNNLPWSHVLESRLQQQQKQQKPSLPASKAGLDFSIVLERGRLAHRIQKLKKAEIQMVNFVQTFMDSDNDGQQESDGRTNSSNDGASGGRSSDRRDDMDEDDDDGNDDNYDEDDDETESDDMDDEDDDDTKDSRSHTQHRGNNAASSAYYKYDLVTVFQSAPLAYRLKSGEVHPLPLLDIEYEKQVLTEALREGSKMGTNIEIDFQAATLLRLGESLAKRDSRVMHLSCHGHSDYLALDNGLGGMEILRVEDLEQFIRFGAGNLDLVFLSACSSKRAGEVFVSAGVPHVVCCHQSHKPRDLVATDFARTFYRALACGKTLKAAFHLARQSVQDGSSYEEQHYMLLPERADEDPYHDVQIFLQRNQTFPGLMVPKIARVNSVPYISPPSRRQSLHMFHVLESLASSDVVKLVGASGGRRLAALLAGYIQARSDTLSSDVLLCLPPIAGEDDEVGRLFRRICNTLKADSHLEVDELMGKRSKYFSHLNEALSYMVGKRCLFIINGKRFGSEVQSLRLQQFMIDLLDHINVKIILACGDGQEHYSGPPEYSERVCIYQMAADDPGLPLEEANIVSHQGRTFANLRHGDHSGDVAGDDEESLSDLSTNSAGETQEDLAWGETQQIHEEIAAPITECAEDSKPKLPIGFLPRPQDPNPETSPEAKTTVVSGEKPESISVVESSNFQSTASDRSNNASEAFNATAMKMVVSARGTQIPNSSDDRESTGIPGMAKTDSVVTAMRTRCFTQGYQFDATGRPKLYGRDKEIFVLKGAYNRVSRPGAPSEIVVVHGPSGAGKSTLVKHIEDTIVIERSGLYAVGKFDEIRAGTKPYSAVVDAFTRLVRRISKGDDWEVVKRNIQEALGSEMKVLSEIIPAISQLTGIPASGNNHIGRMGKGFAFTRFKELFRLFVNALCSPGRPIILFFDDMQWADPASCELIKSLASDPESKSILFVWAFRDSENRGEATSAVTKMIKACSNRLSDISIGAVDAISLKQMIAYLAEQNQREVTPLSDLVFRRTGGNMYFVLQFLHLLQEENQLVFSEELQKWKWDIGSIETQTIVSDNVADLLTAKIARQPGDVQSLLQLAACLGFFFEIELLESICREEGILNDGPATSGSAQIDGLGSNLWGGKFMELTETARNENLIIQTNDPRVFKFAHDCVRQCAYEMVKDKVKLEKRHLSIGMVVWKQMKSKASDDRLLFLSVDQLNRGSQHVVDEDTRTKLAQLNLDSAKKALLKSAYILAADLVNKGIGYLNPRTKWLANKYNVCLDLYSSSAAIEFSLGNFEHSDKQVKEIFAHAHTFEEKLLAYYVRFDSLGIRRRLDEAVNEATEMLRLQGENLPRRPGMVKIRLELANTKRLVKGRNNNEICSLHEMNDKSKVAVMRVLSSIALFAWQSDRNDLLMLVFIRMTAITLTHGLCKYSHYAFAGFGMLLGVFGDIKQAYVFGTLAVELMDKARTGECNSSTRLLVSSFLDHLKKPLSSITQDLVEAYRVGMENGEVQHACISLSTADSLILVTGKPLRAVIADLQQHRQIFQDYKQGDAVAPWLHFALSMVGQRDAIKVLAGDAVDAGFGNEAAVEAQANIHFMRMNLMYILGDLEAAAVELEALERRQGSTGTDGLHFMTNFQLMYSGLVCLALSKRTKRRKHLAGARKYINLMSNLVKEGRANCSPLLHLLQAVQKSTTLDISSKVEVKNAFDDAIVTISGSGFHQIEAVANEIAGEYMLSCQDQTNGHSYLRRAWQLYSEWEADAKVKRLENKYINLRTMMANDMCMPPVVVDQGHHALVT